MSHLYIICFKLENKYNIVESVNITQYLKLLDKYNPSLVDNYLHYSLKKDYRTTQTLIDTTDNIHFLHLIDTTFSEYKIKEGWYRLTPTQLQSLITFISDYITTLPSCSITTTSEYICDKCGKLCKDKRTLANHLKVCPVLHNYQCQNCCKIFVSNTCYQSHILVCKSTIHQCPKCQKILSSNQSLQKHLDNCGIFSCSVCNQHFTSKYKFGRHCQTRHGFTAIV
jgi:hypothetical protein